MFEVHKIYLVPAVKMSAAIACATALAGVIAIGGIAIIAGYIECMMDGYCGSFSLRDAAQIAAFLILSPLIGAVLGAVSALIVIPIYNGIASRMGGITLDFRKVSSLPPAARTGDTQSNDERMAS